MFEPVDLDIAAGIFTEQTPRGARGRWKSGNNVRFRNGIPQKIGGFEKVSTNTYTGVARALFDWVTPRREFIIAAGTSTRLYVLMSNAFYNITPYRLATDFYDGAELELTGPFNTTNGSTTISVDHTGHGLTVGDTVYFHASSPTFAGITVAGEYLVTRIVSSNNYHVHSPAAANATLAAQGGTVDYAYEVNIGSGVTSVGLGWGAGTWGSGTWGTPRGTSTVLLVARVWSLDKWGEDLLACASHGPIYVWDSSLGTGHRATEITQSPDTNGYMLTSALDRHLIAFGAHDGSLSDPLLIRWCSQEDFTDWSPSPTNTAGDFRVESGSEIVCAVRTRGEILVFTDTALYAMSYEGPPYVFSIRSLGEAIGIVGPTAMAEFGGAVYWMSDANFFRYDGGSIENLPCDVQSFVFDNLNFDQKDKISCWINRDWQEVWWEYPSGGSVSNNAYVTYNIIEGTWAVGDVPWEAGHDRSPIYDKPYAVKNGNLYTLETGDDADGAALAAHIESYDTELGAGDDLMHVNKLTPDFLEVRGSVDITIKGKKYPQDASYSSSSGHTVTDTTRKLSVRFRARQVALRIECNAIGDFFRMGKWRAWLRSHGKR